LLFAQRRDGAREIRYLNAIQTTAISTPVLVLVLVASCRLVQIGQGCHMRSVAIRQWYSLMTSHLELNL
jgi:hypothetical protein